MKITANFQLYEIHFSYVSNTSKVMRVVAGADINFTQQLE